MCHFSYFITLHFKLMHLWDYAGRNLQHCVQVQSSKPSVIRRAFVPNLLFFFFISPLAAPPLPSLPTLLSVPSPGIHSWEHSCNQLQIVAVIIILSYRGALPAVSLPAPITGVIN